MFSPDGTLISASAAPHCGAIHSAAVPLSLWPAEADTLPFVYSLNRSSGLVLSPNTWHLADICEEPTGFFEILSISSTSIYPVNKLLCIHVADAKRERLPPVHSPHDIQPRSRSYRKSTLVSKFGDSAAVRIKKQFCPCTVSVLQFPFKRNVQLRHGFKQNLTVPKCSIRF